MPLLQVCPTATTLLNWLLEDLLHITLFVTPCQGEVGLICCPSTACQELI